MTRCVVLVVGDPVRCAPVPENTAVDPENIIKLRKGLKPGQVREWEEPVTA